PAGVLAPIRPTLDQVEGLTAPRGVPAPAGPPDWVREHFRQQHKLLTELWGGEGVPARGLATARGDTNPTTAIDNLHPRVPRRNRGKAQVGLRCEPDAREPADRE